jgi:hypothetical protein
MLSAIRTAAVLALALGATAPAIAQIDTDMPLGVSWNGDSPAGTPPWVNVLFRDFSNIPDFGTFNWIKNTVEVQITTGGEVYDDPEPSCCAVQGKGNLTGRENLKALWLNVHPRIDLSKLKLYWTGASMPPGTVGDACNADGCADTFPAAGLEPTDISIGRDKFRAGSSSCTFDILIQWKGKDKLGQDVDWSKLLLVYDDANEDIDSADFMLPSDACKKAGALFMGVGHIQNTYGPQGGGWIKDGMPVAAPN